MLYPLTDVLPASVKFWFHSEMEEIWFSCKCLVVNAVNYKPVRKQTADQSIYSMATVRLNVN